jgi:hypothetical protein
MSSVADDGSEEAASTDAKANDAFLAWASRHRRRAALDGAWKVEVTERTLRCGAHQRIISSWHDAAKLSSPLRRPQRQRAVPASGKPSSSRCANKSADPQPSKPMNAKQQRSAKRSAANHKVLRFRALRCALLVVRFLVRLRRMALLVLRECDAPSASSPGKRRHSAELLDSDVGALGVGGRGSEPDVASPPQPKRPAPSASPSSSLRAGFLLR